MKGKIIANAQTKSHILESKLTKDNHEEPAITSGKGTANFCIIKKCFIFNVNYCPGSKKSKLDMTLFSDSPFKRSTNNNSLKI